MKSCIKFVLWFLLALNFVPLSFAQGVSYPTASGYVVDQSGIINGETQSKITAWIQEVKQKTTADVSVVTVDSTDPLPIQDYAVNLFQRFGIGQKGKDNGVLLLIAYKDHQIWIETGYGLEGAITDAYCKRIISTIITPEFKQGNFSEGIEKGTAAIVSLIAKEYNVTLTGVPEPVYQDQQSSSIWTILFILCIVASFFLSRGGMFLPGGFIGGYGGGGYGGGGGGFSGGFGGFGGGSCGGGGAGGSW